MTSQPAQKLPLNQLRQKSRQNPSVCACAWIATNRDIGHAAARFLVVLAQHMDQQGTAYPGLDRLAAMTGMSRRSAQRANGELLRHPNAPITRRQRRNTSSVYVLTPAAYDAPQLARRAGKASAEGPRPRGDTAGAAGVSRMAAPEVPSVAAPLGDRRGVLTLGNVDRTANGNGALRDVRSERPRPEPRTCEHPGCAQPAAGAERGRYHCANHPPFWTASGGRL